MARGGSTAALRIGGAGVLRKYPHLNTQKSAPSSLSTHLSLNPFDAAFTSAHPERG
jgi:hypothetical protein